MAIKYLHLSILMLLWSLTGVTAAQTRVPSITIGLFGDTSYSQRERDLLPELMAEMDSEDLAFVIHDGDIKSGGSVCSDAAFLDIRGVFMASLLPLIYVPGSDNNYDGTQRGSGPSQEFLQRSPVIARWLTQAFARARAIKAAGLMVVIQANPDFEAAASGKAHPGYKDFLNQLREETLAFAGQVVLVHGDSHRQQVNQPMRDPNTKEVVTNFTRVETYGSPWMGWIKATVDAKDPKSFDLRPDRFRRSPCTRTSGRRHWSILCKIWPGPSWNKRLSLSK